MIDAQAQGKRKRNEFLKEEEEVICFSIVFMIVDRSIKKEDDGPLFLEECIYSSSCF